MPDSTLISVGTLVVLCLVAATPGICAEIEKLLPNDGAAYDCFGTSVSASGVRAVVGAPYDDDKGDKSGSIYVFYNSGSAWAQVAKLSASDGAANDNFGNSVSISGETIVVGAVGDDDLGSASGSAYVFKKVGATWTQVAKLRASDGEANDNFGNSVSISGDTIVIGAPGDDDLGNASGAAYVFEKPLTGWSGTPTENAKLLASDGAAYDNFGESVSISGDSLVVGAWGDCDKGTYSGSAYVFVKPAGGWLATLTQDAKLLASDGDEWDWFGWSVTISGDTVAVGAWGDNDSGNDSGAAYVFVEPGGGWAGKLYDDAKLQASDAAAGDCFGYSVSNADDVVVVGAYMDDDNGSQSGAAYVFREPGGGWPGTLNEDDKLLASEGAAYDEYGRCVAISGDTIVVGAQADDDLGSASGAAYVFLSWSLGDLNCDGAVDNFDIQAMMLAIMSAGHAPPFDDYLAVYPHCYGLLADINGDGSVNNFDIDPFVELL